MSWTRRKIEFCCNTRSLVSRFSKRPPWIWSTSSWASTFVCFRLRFHFLVQPLRTSLAKILSNGQCGCRWPDGLRFQYALCQALSGWIGESIRFAECRDLGGTNRISWKNKSRITWSRNRQKTCVTTNIELTKSSRDVLQLSNFHCVPRQPVRQK